MMKTKKAAKKRFRFTATGKVKYKKASLRHNLGSKSQGRKRKLRKAGTLFEGDVLAVTRMLPYGTL
jgi:large subunit ribosomal protein L35